jgi:hypothetical protein
MNMDPKLQQINIVRQARGREQEKLDKLIFAITAGTLSLSISFVVGSGRTFVALAYLHASWLALIFALLFVLFGYSSAIFHFTKYENDLWEECLNQPKDSEKNLWHSLCQFFNWASLAATILGIVLFACFAYLNT